MDTKSNQKTKLTIGRLAQATGVNITTVRYYQKRGLLRQPEKPAAGGFRSYTRQDQERLLLIRQAQELGFSLAEISELVAYVEERNCRAVEVLADKKLKNIKGQIALLENVRKTLSLLLAGCPHELCDHCPLMQKLARTSSKAT